MAGGVWAYAVQLDEGVVGQGVFACVAALVYEATFEEPFGGEQDSLCAEPQSGLLAQDELAGVDDLYWRWNEAVAYLLDEAGGHALGAFPVDLNGTCGLEVVFVEGGAAQEASAAPRDGIRDGGGNRARSLDGGRRIPVEGEPSPDGRFDCEGVSCVSFTVVSDVNRAGPSLGGRDGGWGVEEIGA